MAPRRAAALRWTTEQARRYQLFAVRLLGADYPAGDEGIRRAFSDLGGVQLDPLPVLGRNHDLVLQARVDGTHPDQALDLVHRERLGFEYWDKVLCALPIREYRSFQALMRHGGERWLQGRADRLAREHPGAIEAVRDAVSRHGPLSSRELKAREIAQGDHRGWKSTKAANAALEVLWNRGDIAVSHREGYRRYFDLTERVIPAGERTGDPVPIDAFWGHLLLKRVRSVGLLPTAGDAEVWAFLRDARRDGLPERLVASGALVYVDVEGIKARFLADAGAKERLAAAERADDDGRARFIAPLDPLLWARTALSRLWGFDYVWEVYKPAAQRKHGYYVLPILYNGRFVARFDGRYDRAAGTLRVLAYFAEDGGLPIDDPRVADAFQRFLQYLGGERIELPGGPARAGAHRRSRRQSSGIS